MNTALPIGNLLHQAWKLYRHRLKPIFAIAFVLGVIREAITLSLPTIEISQGGNIDVSVTATTVIALIVILLLSVLASALIIALLHNAKVTMKQASLLVLRHIGALLVAGILFSVLFAWGIRLYVVPGLLVATVFYLYQPLILFHGRRGLTSLMQSAYVIKPYFFLILGLVVLSFLLTLLPNLLILSLSKGALKDWVGIDSVLTIFVNAFVMPYTLCLVMVAYQFVKSPNSSK